MVQSFTVISSSLPMRSPIWIALLPLYTSLISTSLRSTLDRSSVGHLKDMSWVVTARLSLVPAKPILSLDTYAAGECPDQAVGLPVPADNGRDREVAVLLGPRGVGNLGDDEILR